MRLYQRSTDWYWRINPNIIIAYLLSEFIQLLSCVCWVIFWAETNLRFFPKCLRYGLQASVISENSISLAYFWYGFLQQFVRKSMITVLLKIVRDSSLNGLWLFSLDFITLPHTCLNFLFWCIHILYFRYNKVFWVGGKEVVERSWTHAMTRQWNRQSWRYIFAMALLWLILLLSC